jgi:hypothetical protein
MLHHFTILQEQGYDAEIDSYIDSAEYQTRFGEETVPYLHGWNYSAGQQGLQFSYMLQLTRVRRPPLREISPKTSPASTRPCMQRCLCPW